MKETLVTRGLFDAGLIKAGQRIRTRYDNDVSYTGVVTGFRSKDVLIQYDDGDTDELYIPGFETDPEVEANASQRLYLLEDEAPVDLYMLLDTRCNRILLKAVNMEQLAAYALTDFREVGCTDHLAAVPMSNVKPVKLGVTL